MQAPLAIANDCLILQTVVNNRQGVVKCVNDSWLNN